MILLDVCGVPDLLHFALSGSGIALAAPRTLLHASVVLGKSACILAGFAPEEWGGGILLPTRKVRGLVPESPWKCLRRAQVAGIGHWTTSAAATAVASVRRLALIETENHSAALGAG